jgi:hypothetical protein
VMLARDGAYGRSDAPRDKPRGVSLTSRDLRLLGWLGRAGAALPAQAAAYIGHHPVYVQLRLQVMWENQIVDRHHLLKGAYVYTLSARGLALAELEALGPAQVSRQSLQHALSATWLSIELEHDESISNVIYERELNLLPGHWSFIPRRGAPSANGVGRFHRPDLAIETTAGGRRAIELERSLKAPDRLAQIIASYGAATTIEKVVYYAVGDLVVGALEHAVRTTGTEQMVEIRRWSSPSPIVAL